MALSTGPFSSFSAFYDSDFDRVVVTWVVVDGLNVSKVHVEVDRGSGFSEIDNVSATAGRIIDSEGSSGDDYRLVGEASTGELWVATKTFTAQGSSEPTATITGKVLDASGQPVFNASVKAFTLYIEGISSKENAITDGEIEVKTNTAGEFSLKLLRGSFVRFEIPDANISFPTEIPDKESVKFGDLDTLDGDYIR